MEDFNIPVLYGYRVGEVIGNERIEGVIVEHIEENFNEECCELNEIQCDCLLISVNFLPEKELGDKIGLNINKETLGIEVDEKYRTNLDGIFAAGGVTKGYGAANVCINEGKIAGIEACKYCLDK